jgi:hypothetical protein
MSLARLDFYFPFFLCLYGFMLIFAEFVSLKANIKYHPAYQQIANKAPFAWICLVVGTIWAVQNLLIQV